MTTKTALECSITDHWRSSTRTSNSFPTSHHGDRSLASYWNTSHSLCLAIVKWPMSLPTGENPVFYLWILATRWCLCYKMSAIEAQQQGFHETFALSHKLSLLSELPLFSFDDCSRLISLSCIPLNAASDVVPMNPNDLPFNSCVFSDTVLLPDFPTVPM